MGILRKTRHSKQSWFVFLTCNWTEKATVASSRLDPITSPRGSKRWSKKVIETVLTNVKYTGNVEVMKSSLTGNRYVLRNSHTAIIPMEKFAAVQEQIEARAKRKRQTEHVSKTFVEEIKWDKPIVSSETNRVQEPKEMNWPEPQPEKE